MREKTFETELNYIKNSNLKEVGIKMLNLLPEYFFEIPASSTGKYHPTFALGDGGLVRHTKVAMKVGKTLLDNPCIGEKYTDDEKDLMLLALMIHDGCKSGLIKERYTAFDHPLVVSKLIKDNQMQLGLSDKELEVITSTVETHMGPWTKDYNGNEVLMPPQTKYQRFVHMCDYLAAQKWLDVKFNGNEIRSE